MHGADGIRLVFKTACPLLFTCKAMYVDTIKATRYVERFVLKSHRLFKRCGSI
jgi:hypothetical protein